MATRIGVDVGGTFTDLVFYDDGTGETLVAKAPTTASPEDGILALVRSALGDGELASSAYFLHGTTVALNALLERKGAKVGLLATAGFRDLLEFRRGERTALYDATWKAPPPLVPRHLRLPVSERVLFDGSVLTPLLEEDVRNAAVIFNEEGVECVAIAFLNAYANPEHELQAARVLRAAGFGGDVALSHAVTGEYREYERTSTTVVDAYIRPRTAHYLERLKDGLRDAGFRGTNLITRCGGGSMTFEEAQRRPFEIIMSGPVAGTVATLELCAELGIEAAVTADVGGTSFDTCLLIGGRMPVKFEGSAAGMPLQTPWVDVRSIGAGGGSIAWVDEGGLLHVGPASAGANPGPAGYGRGGTEATVSDAAAFLGLLGMGELAGGLTLDFDLAEQALERLARRLAISVANVAQGILKIAAANMANAVRAITLEQGQDPRSCTLVAFGGAGPVLATLLATELDTPRVVVPRNAGGFSAWGLLGQDVTRTAGRTVLARLDQEGLNTATMVMRSLAAELDERTGGTLGPADGEIHECVLDLRYQGQEHTLATTFPLRDRELDAGLTEIAAAFTARYSAAYAVSLDDPIEIVAVHVTSRLPLPLRKVTHASTAAGEPRSVDAFSFTEGCSLPFAVLAREGLAAGSRISGPAMIVEETTSTVIDAGWTVEVHATGHLLLTRQGA